MEPSSSTLAPSPEAPDENPWSTPSESPSVAQTGQLRAQSHESGMSDALPGLAWAEGGAPTPPEKDGSAEAPAQASQDTVTDEKEKPDVSEFDPFAKPTPPTPSSSSDNRLSQESAGPPSPPPSESKPAGPVLSAAHAEVPQGSTDVAVATPPKPADSPADNRSRSTSTGAGWTQLFGLRSSIGHGGSGPNTPTNPPAAPEEREKESLREKMGFGSSTTSKPSTPVNAGPTSGAAAGAPGSAGSAGSFSFSAFASALKAPLVRSPEIPTTSTFASNASASGSGSGRATPTTPRAASRLQIIAGRGEKFGRDLPSSPGEKEPFTPTRGGTAPADHDPPPSVPGGTPSGAGRSESEDRKDEEPAMPFDFNRFLEQMRHRGAEPVGKYLRSFLKEFQKRTVWTVWDQIRVINDFLDFISVKMRELPDGPWHPSVCSEAEFDNAVEAMEKLVMNRVWHLTYTPALPSYLLPSATDDLERDAVMGQKMKLFGWVTEANLDLDLSGSQPPEAKASASEASEAQEGREDEADELKGTEKQVERMEPAAKPRDPGVDGFLEFAKQELLKINQYKAPRDKMICILNCCKVIFGLIRHLDSTEGADTFIPILILVVLKASPDHVISNLQYIQRFRNPDKLQGESGYYLSSLNAAVSFIERLDHASLSNISQSEFEKNVEQAILTLPRSAEPTPELTQAAFPKAARTTSTVSALSVTPSTPRAGSPGPSAPAPSSRPRTPISATTAGGRQETESAADIQPNVSFPDATKAWFQRMPDLVERGVSKPLNAIARIVDDIAGDKDGIDERDQSLSAYQQLQSQLHSQQQQQQLHQQQHQQPSQPQSQTPYPGASTAPISPPRTIDRRTSTTSLNSRRRGTRTWATQPLDLAQQSPMQGSRPARSRQTSHLSATGGSSIPSTPLSHPDHAGAYVPDSVDPAAVAAEMEKRDRLQRQQHAANIDTLRSIFPSLPTEVLEVVLVTQQGEMSKTIDALLEMSTAA